MIIGSCDPECNLPSRLNIPGRPPAVLSEMERGSAGVPSAGRPRTVNRASASDERAGRAAERRIPVAGSACRSEEPAAVPVEECRRRLTLPDASAMPDREYGNTLAHPQDRNRTAHDILDTHTAGGQVLAFRLTMRQSTATDGSEDLSAGTCVMNEASLSVKRRLRALGVVRGSAGDPCGPVCAGSPRPSGGRRRECSIIRERPSMSPLPISV